MYLYFQNKAFVSNTTVALGNMVSKTFIGMMILATFVLPQATMGQRDVDLDEPPSSIDEISTTAIDNDEGITHQQDTKRIITKTSTSHVYGQIAAGKLSNKIDPTTIASYAKGGGRGSILCSTIARININILTGLPYHQGGFGDDSIARGDAYALALHGAARGQMITTSKSTMESDIWTQYDQTHNTIFDVYFYKGSNGGVMQGHRAVVFIGTDDVIYILDPIRGLATSRPQSLSDHFEADEYRGYTMYIARTSYAPAPKYQIIEEFYETANTVSLTSLVSDGVATVQNSPLSDDVLLTVNQPIKMHDDTQEMIIEQGAVIRIKNTTHVVGWKLNFESTPTKKVEAVLAQPELGGVITPWDR